MRIMRKAITVHLMAVVKHNISPSFDGILLFLSMDSSPGTIACFSVSRHYGTQRSLRKDRATPVRTEQGESRMHYGGKDAVCVDFMSGVH